MKSIIIYATKYGSVKKAAEILNSKMGNQVFLVNIMKEDIPSLDEYDNIILGGSIYIGKVQKKLTDFILSNLPFLMKKRIGLFICAGLPDLDARDKELKSVFPSELFNHAAAKEVFGYEIYFEKLNFLHKIAVKVVMGKKASISELDENKINKFAKAILSE